MIAVVVVLLIAGAVVAGRSIGGLLERTRYAERPRIERVTPRPTAPAVPERPVTLPWQLEPGALRPDLAGAEFVGPVDGDFNGPYCRPSIRRSPTSGWP